MRLKISMLLFFFLFPMTSGCESSSEEALTEAPTARSGGNRVVIVDQGMKMPIGAVHAPAGWEVRQDIATDLQTAGYARYLLDVQGPPGLIRGLGMSTYDRMFGQGFEPAVEAIVMRGLQGFENIQFGEVETNARRAGQPNFQKAQKQIRANGLDLQAVQARFSATANGRPIAGRVEVDHTLFIQGNQHTGGMVYVGLLISTPDNLAELTRMSDKIAAQFEPNPEYDGARSRIIDGVTARSQVAHQQRMNDNQARFNAHQQRMRQNSAANDARNQQWLSDFRGSGTTGSGASNYSNHDQFIDSIGERTRFDDPYTGEQQTQDGQYDRWATDGLGNYIGSDDAFFDPSAFDGNFEEIQPLN